MLLRHFVAAMVVSAGISGAAQASPAALPALDSVQVAYARYGHHYRHHYYRHHYHHYRRVHYRRYGHYRPVRVVRYYRPYRYGYYRPARVVRHGYPVYRHVRYRPYRWGYYGRPYGYYHRYGYGYGYGPRYYPHRGASLSIGF